MRTLSTIISGLGDNMRRTIQDCETAYSAWTKLHNRYTGKSMGSKLRALNHLLDCRYKPRTEMGVHVAQFYSQFATWMAMGSELENL